MKGIEETYCLISNMGERNPSVKVLSNTSNTPNHSKAAVMIKARDVSSLRSCFKKKSLVPYLGSNSIVVISPPLDPL